MKKDGDYNLKALVNGKGFVCYIRLDVEQREIGTKLVIEVPKHLEKFNIGIHAGAEMFISFYQKREQRLMGGVYISILEMHSYHLADTLTIMYCVFNALANAYEISVSNTFIDDEARICFGGF